jgi:alpha-beta hydrolase superfamily lysophospholipase
MIWVYIILGAVLFFFVIPTFIMSWILYSVLLRRTRPEKWDRSCSIPDDKEYRRMFDIGMAWEQEHRACKREVEIRSDGLRLVGEYFDFGSKKAALIIAGRMESLLYSYFFAEPFRRAGYNVLVIDNRAHGLSEGKISSLGYREYRDVLGWIRLLQGDLGNEKVFLHGICIGASTALFAAISDDCPDCVEGLCAEGMYVNFYESFLNHMKVDRPDKMRFPIVQETMLWIRLVSGANVVTDGPLRRIDRLKKPILFLHSLEDQYSTPEKTKELFARCTAPKKLVWFDRGAHSRIRINNTEAYDEAIAAFLREIDAGTY